MSIYTNKPRTTVGLQVNRTGGEKKTTSSVWSPVRCMRAYQISLTRCFTGAGDLLEVDIERDGDQHRLTQSAAWMFRLVWKTRPAVTT